MKNVDFQPLVPAFVPLAEAVLCMDCECISRQSGEHFCAGCGSGSVLNLAAVLNPLPLAEGPPIAALADTESEVWAFCDAT